MVVGFGADPAGFGAVNCLFCSAKALGAGAGGVTASAAKDCTDVLASFALAALEETFAVAGAGIETGLAALSARGLLPSVVEMLGAIRSGEFAGEDISAARFTPGDLLVFLMVSFAEFIFK